MGTLKTVYVGDFRTETVHPRSGARIVTLSPDDDNLYDNEFSPTDLVGVALASCILSVINLSAQHHGFPVEGATAEVTKIMASAPSRRIGELTVNLRLPHDYDEKTQQRIKHLIRVCPVGGSLHPDLRQRITIHFGPQGEKVVEL